MRFSLRSLILTTTLFGMLPVLYEYWLVPFFVIIAICMGMSLRAFATEFRDDQLD